MIKNYDKGDDGDDDGDDDVNDFASSKHSNSSKCCFVELQSCQRSLWRNFRPVFVTPVKILSPPIASFNTITPPITSTKHQRQ